MVRSTGPDTLTAATTVPSTPTTGALTEAQVRRLLGLETRFQVHALLKAHHVPLQYTSADLAEDLRAQRELGILSPR